VYCAVLLTKSSFVSVRCIPPHVKTKLQKSGASGQVTPIDDSRMCPLQVYYDGDIHDALANLRRVDGSIPFSKKYGMSVNFFAPSGKHNFWTRASTPELGYFIHILFVLFELLHRTLLCSFLAQQKQQFSISMFCCTFFIISKESAS
jgi:hypothetical protein